MISESPRSRNPAGHAGLLENLLALASALAEFFESRFALFAQESKTAAVHLLILAGCLIHNWRGCGTGAPAWNFMGLDSACRCCTPFHYCVGLSSHRAQPHDQAGFPHDAD